MAALTPQLLADRFSVLAKRASEGVSPPTGVLFMVIVCDRCGRRVDLEREFLPKDWTTAGDLDGGFTDLCGACSS